MLDCDHGPFTTLKDPKKVISDQNGHPPPQTRASAGADANAEGPGIVQEPYAYTFHPPSCACVSAGHFQKWFCMFPSLVDPRKPRYPFWM